MILLDTNVLIFALGKPSPYLRPCRAIVSAAGMESARINTDVEALQEALRVWDRRGQREFGLDALGELRKVFHSPLPVTALDVDRSAELLRRHGRLCPRDGIHAAIALKHEARAFVSADKAFDGIEGLNWIDPIEFARQLDAEQETPA